MASKIINKYNTLLTDFIPYLLVHFVLQITRDVDWHLWKVWITQSDERL